MGDGGGGNSEDEERMLTATSALFHLLFVFLTCAFYPILFPSHGATFLYQTSHLERQKKLFKGVIWNENVLPGLVLGPHVIFSSYLHS